MSESKSLTIVCIVDIMVCVLEILHGTGELNETLQGLTITLTPVLTTDRNFNEITDSILRFLLRVQKSQIACSIN